MVGWSENQGLQDLVDSRSYRIYRSNSQQWDCWSALIELDSYNLEVDWPLFGQKFDCL